ncbi:MAG: hypothetical protein RR708_04380 [Bacilli bacterium]
MSIQKNMKPIYYCEIIDNNDGLLKYSFPKLRHLNYQPIESKTTLYNVGEVSSESLIVSMKYIGENYKEKSKVYIYNKPPEKYDETADNADFIIETVKPFNTSVEIVLKKIVGK